MKLIFCRKCGDVFSLRMEKKYCECGECWGYYLSDEITAMVSADAVPFGIGNGLFHLARLGEVPVFHGFFYDSPWFTDDFDIGKNIQWEVPNVRIDE